MGKTLEFVIEGRPVPKQRVRTRNGRFYTPKETRRYEDSVAWQARKEHAHSLGDVEVEITLCSQKPLRGDIDNYAKAILDGLVKGGVLHDDRVVSRLSIARRRSERDFAHVILRFNEDEGS